MSDLRKELLRRNLGRKIQDIVQNHVQKNKGRQRRYLSLASFNNTNKNLCVIFPKKCANIVVLIWGCCENVEPVFVQDLSLYKEQQKCEKCSKVPEKMKKIRKPKSKEIDEIIQKHINENKDRRRRYYSFGLFNNNNHNYRIIFPKDQSTNTVILKWRCCESLEPVFAQDMHLYKEKENCERCSSKSRKEALKKHQYDFSRFDVSFDDY
ncbi:UNVERIFIED_CONTAM: hypothetical protein RMT77_019649 [Armadillidium vulgare]